MLNWKCFSKPGMEVAVLEGDSSTGPKKSRLSREEPPLATERGMVKEERKVVDREHRKAEVDICSGLD